MLNSSISRTVPRWVLLGCLSALLAIAGLIPGKLLAEDSTQRVFPTPQAAVDALVAAAKADDPKAAAGPILGPDSDKILSSGDKVADDNARSRFVSKYKEMHRLAYDSDGRVIFYLGADNWPFPIPLVKKDNGWIFDTAAGEKEMLYRRIGANELYTIDVLENLVQAQNEYSELAKSTTGVAQYAQKILSDQGLHNGLYWPAAGGQPESPIGPLIAEAVSQGYRKGEQGQPVPFHGYIYRVLTAQGKNAPGGARNYIRNGRMTRGFAFLAYPASYGSSGVMTFIVGSDGTVLQKDLGSDTANLAAEITAFNPDKSWQAASPDALPPEEEQEAAQTAQSTQQ
jgi:hypothetical protein